MASKKPKSQKKTVVSGAVGGPSAFRGTGYQINYAIVEALEAIGRALGDPLYQATITVEPRDIENGEATKWDVSVSSADSRSELKLNPTREDVLEWVTVVDHGSSQSESRRF